METQELLTKEKLAQKIQLVKGDFTASEASHIIMKLIDEKINFHKIQRLQLWEGNHKCNTNQLDGRIKELEKEKLVAKGFIDKMRSSGKNLSINGILEINVGNHI